MAEVIEGTPGTTGTTGTPGTEATPETNWYDGLNLTDEYKGLIQTKHFKDANELVKSYQNIEKLSGVDKNELIRIPKAKEGEEADYSEVWKALGRPDKAEDYGLADNDFAKAAGEEMHKLGLSVKQAKALSDFIDKYSAEHQQQDQSAREAELDKAAASQQEALKKEWGADFDRNLEVARTAVADLKDKLGLDGDVLDKLGDTIGVDKAAKIFYLLGKQAAEDGSLNLTNYASKNGGETPEIATYKVKEMCSDPETAKKIMAGDVKTINELNRLNGIIASSKNKGV